jgi:galactokinase
MSIDLKVARERFEAHFGCAPEIATRAPGRVNIIGEHTDYNHGFVLPMAIDRETVLLARPRNDRKINAFAANMDRSVMADLDHRVRNADESWIDYVIGVADELIAMEKPIDCGVDLLILGDVPVACGLSSSAALEMASVCLFEALGDYRIDGPDAARLGQRVENGFLGLSSGIMDQFISRCGKEGHVLFLDCRSFAYDLVPVAFPGAVFVIANTCCARGLTSSKYNERVGECREAVETMRVYQGRQEATHLRDFTLEDLAACKDQMSPIAFRRARHVITEDQRTQAACNAMREGNVAHLGELMTASGESLRNDYEVTSPELDAMVSTALSLPGCHGARMTGAGFGGCTVNLVAEREAESFVAALLAGYKDKTGIDGEAYVTRPSQGAGILESRVGAL